MNIAMNNEYQKVQLNETIDRAENGQVLRRSLMINIREESIEKAWKLYKELKKKIDGKERQSKNDKQEKGEKESEENIPVCPECGIQMLPKQNSKKGNWFWGCPNFPACKQTRPYDKEKELKLEDIPF